MRRSHNLVVRKPGNGLGLSDTTLNEFAGQLVVRKGLVGSNPTLRA